MVDLNVDPDVSLTGRSKKVKKNKTGKENIGENFPLVVKKEKKNNDLETSGILKKKKKKRPSGDGGGGEEEEVQPKKRRSVKFDNAPVKHEFQQKKFKKEKGNKKQKLEAKIRQKKAAKGKGKKAGDNSGQISKKEGRDKQRKLKAERRSKKGGQVYDIGVQAKKVWEDVRREDCPEDKKEKLLKELAGLVKGSVQKIVFAHDTVRVVECLMAMGSQEIREELFQELKGDILEMSKSKYANFFVQKILRYGTKEQKAHVFKTMEGHVAKLMKHKTAGNVVELAYNDYASASQRNCMLQEFLGPEYRLFKEPEVRKVKEILEKHPEKKHFLLKHMAENVEVLITKGTFNHSLVHTVLYNYLSVAEPAKRSETIEHLREAILHMIHSRDGAMAGLLAIWHGTSKDRKSIIKSFKTHVTRIATDEYGHLVLLGIFDSVDDTKLVGKAIISELAENLEEIMKNKFGIRVVKYLMCGRDSTYTYPDVIKMMQEGDGNEHSKKEQAVRHRELLEYASPAALGWAASHLTECLYDPPSTITLTAIINNSPPSEAMTNVLSMLSEEAAKPFVPGDAEPNIIENGASNMMLKKIVQKDKERAADSQAKTFSEILLNTIDEDGLESWLTCNRGAFLLVIMMETGVDKIVKLVREKLKKLSKTLKKQKTKGGEILQKKLSS